MSEVSYQSRGLGYLPLLTILFIGLKLAEVGVVAHWSWWWVLAPTWIPVVLGLVVFVCIFGGALLIAWLKEYK